MQSPESPAWPYGLSVKTPPAAEPLTAAEVREHLRVDDTSEDTLINLYITAAREWLEVQCNESFITRTLVLSMAGFPRYRAEIVLPRPPLISVTTVEYTDPDNATQTFTDWQEWATTQPGRLCPLPSAEWPATATGLYEAVQVTYDAGHGALATDVPERFRHAMRLLVGEWYENREQVQDRPLNSIPDGIGEVVQSLRTPYYV